MADILLQNAIAGMSQQIRSSSSKLNYTSALGVSLQDFVGSLITANVSDGPFANVGLGDSSAYICDLSDVTKISSCTANYAGSGTSSTASSNTVNPWTNSTVLKGVISLDVPKTTIITKINGYSAILNSIWNESNTIVGNDIYLAYLALKQVYTSSNNTTVLRNWYGVGINTEGGQGAPLNQTNKLKVCGAGWICGQGATCTWTVPAGATKAKFQVWGAGQGTNPGCCCGGASFGATGAYSEMVLCVTPGAQYSICAGCSCARWCCSNTAPGYGCMSGVTGPGICCLKADGSNVNTSNCDDMNYARCAVGLGSACYRFQNIYCAQGGACWCSNNEYCGGSCDTCGVVAVYPSCCYARGCSCADPALAVKDGPQNVMFGLHGGGCFDSNLYGYHTRPPIIDADTGLEFTGGCMCQTFTSGNCCGGCLGTGWTWHPGQGGAATHVMGGANDHKGDTGRAGMVQVSWI